MNKKKLILNLFLFITGSIFGMQKDASDFPSRQVPVQQVITFRQLDQEEKELIVRLAAIKRNKRLLQQRMELRRKIAAVEAQLQSTVLPPTRRKPPTPQIQQIVPQTRDRRIAPTISPQPIPMPQAQSTQTSQKEYNWLDKAQRCLVDGCPFSGTHNQIRLHAGKHLTEYRKKLGGFCNPQNKPTFSCMCCPLTFSNRQHAEAHMYYRHSRNASQAPSPTAVPARVRQPQISLSTPVDYQVASFNPPVIPAVSSAASQSAARALNPPPVPMKQTQERNRKLFSITYLVPCPDCNNLIEKEGLQTHINAKHKKRKRKTDSLKEKERKKKIRKKEYAHISFSCMQCPKKYSGIHSSKSLIRHIKQKHITNNICSLCKFHGTDSKSMHGHIVSRHIAQKCRWCDETFTYVVEYKKHTEQHLNRVQN